MLEIILVPLIVVVAFYVILLRPVINQQKRRKRDLTSMAVGDEVLTAGGFYALVRDIQTTDDGPMEILLEVADGVVVRGTTEAILEVTKPAADVAPGRTDVSDSDGVPLGTAGSDTDS